VRKSGRVNSVIIQISRPEDINNECLELVTTCYVQQKDLLLYISTPHSNTLPILQNLDLWWNLEDGESIEIITRYASVLQSSKRWKDSDVTVNVVATNENLDSVENFVNKFTRLPHFFFNRSCTSLCL
jgi:hypothetical protein